MAEKKLIVVIGATGNQGGAVVDRFLKDSRFQVRGLTRDPSATNSQALAAKGVEVVKADLHDADALKLAFRGANVIFSVTQYWEPYFRPDRRQQAIEQGISIRKLAYDLEYAAGKCIVDAAATTASTLDQNGFLVSTLSNAKESDIFPRYVNENYPELAAKMSCIHTGYFMTSHQLLPECYFRKVSFDYWPIPESKQEFLTVDQLPDGSIRMEFNTVSTKPQPHLDVNSDAGNFAHAVYQMPPGKSYMSEGTTCTWPEWIVLWSKVTGVQATYKQVSSEEVTRAAPDPDLGLEVAYMFAYSSDPGYDGGMDLIKAADMRKAGIDCPMTSLGDWMAKQDWSQILAKSEESSKND